MRFVIISAMFRICMLNTCLLAMEHFHILLLPIWCVWCDGCQSLSMHEPDYVLQHRVLRRLQLELYEQFTLPNNNSITYTLPATKLFLIDFTVFGLSSRQNYKFLIWCKFCCETDIMHIFCYKLSQRSQAGGKIEPKPNRMAFILAQNRPLPDLNQKFRPEPDISRSRVLVLRFFGRYQSDD